MTQVLCEDCGVAFEYTRSRRTRFCSRQCYAKSIRLAPSSKYASDEYLGTRVGTRTIVEILPGGGRSTFWIMTCDCGNSSKRVASTTALRAGTCKSCSSRTKGVARGSKWPSGRNIDGQLYRRWFVNAQQRELQWSISLDFLDNLIEQQNWRCAVSGLPIDAASRHGDCSVDRIDSKLPYTITNVHLVTKMVNMSKQTFGLSEFVAMCRSVSTYQEGFHADI